MRNRIFKSKAIFAVLFKTEENWTQIQYIYICVCIWIFCNDLRRVNIAWNVIFSLALFL